MRLSLRISVCALALGAAILVFCSCGKKPTAGAAAVDLTGQWNGTYGAMAIRHAGGKISAVYEYRCGQVSGTVTGTHVDFLWWENASGLPYDSAPLDARGDGYFDVVAHGDSLVGKWRFEGTPDFNRDWVALRLSHTPDSASIVDNCVQDTIP